jgi:uncharacterized membrane protein
MHYGWGGIGGFGFGGVWMIGGFLVMVGIVVLAAWVISTLVRGPRPADRYDGRLDARPDGRPDGQPGGRPDARPTANEILRERFARGEINEEEFGRMQKALGPDR